MLAALNLTGIEIITFSVLLVLVIVLFVWIIFLQLALGRIKRRNEEFFGGEKVKNLEELLIANAKSIRVLDKDIQELYGISNQINALAFRGLHKVGLVRYNPFKDVGGDQSFALAMLNGKNNGVTISSLYTREGARIYAKSIIGGQTDKHPLTEEEKQAIEMAIDEKSNIKNQKSKVQVKN